MYLNGHVSTAAKNFLVAQCTLSIYVKSVVMQPTRKEKSRNAPARSNLFMVIPFDFLKDTLFFREKNWIWHRYSVTLHV